MGGGNKIEDQENASNQNEANEHGNPKQYDPNFKGPLKDRSCTDIICCVFFLVFLVGMAGCSFFGYALGDPKRLTYPTDSMGNLCGKGKFKDKPNLMFFNILECLKMGPKTIVMGCPTPQVCVKQCTSSYYVYLETLAALNLRPNDKAAKEKMLCKYNVDVTKITANDVENLIKKEDCASYYVKTTEVFGRCVPAVSEITDMALNSGNFVLKAADGTKVTRALLKDANREMARFFKYGQQVYADVIKSWQSLLVGLGLTMLLAMIWIVLMRWIAGIMVWLTIFAVLGCLGFSTYFSLDKYMHLKSQNVTASFEVKEIFSKNWNKMFNLQEIWLTIGCISAIVLLILLLILLFLCMRIRIAIELIKEGSRALGHMFSTLFWPLIPFIFELVAIVYWIASAVYVASVGKPEYSTSTAKDDLKDILHRIPCTPDDTTTLNKICKFAKYGGDEYTIYMQVYMGFMFLWILNFIIALGQMVLAGAFASYYWAYEKPKDIPAFPLAGSLWRTVRYHLGSIAFGSLIIAIVQFIRIFLMYLDNKMKGSQNSVAKFFLKCLKCFFYCLEKFLKFLTKNAYILIAVYGKNFCVSAKDAFSLIMRNTVRTVVLDKTTDFVLFLSKLLVTAAVSAGAYFWFDGRIDVLPQYQLKLNFPLVPVIILTIAAYLVSCIFFSVYSMAVSTIYLCFLEDLEKHDGSPGKPYFMSKSMMSLMDKKNKFKEPSGKD
ncbi:choline transporter-like protein 4 [Gigantopelta aegis]|uniref:choline transporter-like protein 4 n=1 Tax=Gigantopelta aegis TaxID=1735272 RepID=UPI001B88A373|nr:choline transporter-like protein 4 [Gigantopelta aegis]